MTITMRPLLTSFNEAGAIRPRKDSDGPTAVKVRL